MGLSKVDALRIFRNPGKLSFVVYKRITGKGVTISHESDGPILSTLPVFTHDEVVRVTRELLEISLKVGLTQTEEADGKGPQIPTLTEDIISRVVADVHLNHRAHTSTY